MLHAFNQKNVRRVLARGDDEHTNEKTEDAITSMVFSPLVFMPPEQAFRALLAVLGTTAAAGLTDRRPVAHELRLWPAGMFAAGWDDARLTRCEPDLVAEFHFEAGESVVFVGEMKWDWQMTDEALARELAREREAVCRHYRLRDPLMFVVAKYRRAPMIASVPVLNWVDVLERLSALKAEASDSPARRWAEQVTIFLGKADLEAFGGFPQMGMMVSAWRRGHAFWEAKL